MSNDNVRYVCPQCGAGGAHQEACPACRAAGVLAMMARERPAQQANPTYDLIGWKEGEEHRLAACSENWLGTAVNYRGGGSLIAQELHALDRSSFPTLKDAERWFLFHHTKCFSDKHNGRGQPYPVALEAHLDITGGNRS
jgi:hypothetical protein